MSKSVRLSQVLFGCLMVLIGSGSIFAQSGNLQNDLQSSFKKFKLARLDAGNASRRALLRQSIIVPTTSGSYELNLMPHDLRTRSYRAEETRADGSFALDKSAVTTFKGKISGESESEVRLTIDGTKIEGYFLKANGERLFIEPAAVYSKSAEADDYVVFAEKDALKNGDFECLSELEEKIERGKEMLGSSPSATSTLRVLEIATEADNAFVNELGGATQANNEILSILNMIEGAYEAELNLSIDVVFQHAWTSADPYGGTSASTTLNNFRNFWNANYPTTSVPRDLAHIWTSRSNLAGVGVSYLGTVCRNPTSAYGLSGRLNYENIQYVLSAHEIGHSLNANHVSAAQGCDNTIMIPVVSNLTPLNFCPYSRDEIGNYIGGSGNCLTERVNSAKTNFDFDGDGKADVSVYRPSNGAWYLNQSAAGFTAAQFGTSTDKIVPADYDGDGKTDIAVYRNGVWYLNRSQAGFTGISFGTAEDIPAPADYDGDGKADVAVFRPSNGAWYIQGSQSGFRSASFGMANDIPVAADFDGDGKADINVFRPSNGAWYRMNSSTNQFFGTSFGQAGDKPLAADFDGDGKSDLAVYRPSNGNWYRITSSNNLFAAISFGVSTDVPTPGDYDGDGKSDISVFRPASGAWYRYNSGSGAMVGLGFGSNGDAAVPGYYLH